jgi:hypothetical protein
VATAVSVNHLCTLLGLLESLPPATVLVFSLEPAGHGSDALCAHVMAHSADRHNISCRQFPFDRHPAHLRLVNETRGFYAWKAVIVDMALAEVGKQHQKKNKKKKNTAAAAAAAAANWGLQSP